MHSNRLCVVGVAPYHPLVRDKLRISSIEIPQHMTDNRVTGKKKKGGMWLEPATILCKVITECTFWLMMGAYYLFNILLL